MLKLKKYIDPGESEEQLARVPELMGNLRSPEKMLHLTCGGALTASDGYIFLYQKENPEWNILIEISSENSIALVHVGYSGILYPVRKESYPGSDELRQVKLYRFFISMIAAKWITKETNCARALIKFCDKHQNNYSKLSQMQDTDKIYTALLNGRITDDEEKENTEFKLNSEEN